MYFVWLVSWSSFTHPLPLWSLRLASGFLQEGSSEHTNLKRNLSTVFPEVKLPCILQSISRLPNNYMASLVAQTAKPLPVMREIGVRSLGREDPLEKEMATHSSTLAWEIPWTEDRGGLYGSWGQKESETTERLYFPLSNNYIEANLEILLWNLFYFVPFGGCL